MKKNFSIKNGNYLKKVNTENISITKDEFENIFQQYLQENYLD